MMLLVKLNENLLPIVMLLVNKTSAIPDFRHSFDHFLQSDQLFQHKIIEVYIPSNRTHLAVHSAA